MPKSKKSKSKKPEEIFKTPDFVYLGKDRIKIPNINLLKLNYYTAHGKALRQYIYGSKTASRVEDWANRPVRYLSRTDIADYLSGKKYMG